VLLGCLLRTLGESPKDATKFYYAAGIILTFIPASLFTQHSFLGFETIGMQMSSATSAVIYRKVSLETLGMLTCLISFIIFKIFLNQFVVRVPWICNFGSINGFGNILQILRLSQKSVQELSTGQIINHLSNDVRTFLIMVWDYSCNILLN